MAASSREGADLSVLQPGQDRQIVESVLGKPISVIRMGYGDEATYTFVSDDEANYGRAAVYALLTGVTLGVSEFVTTPVEMLQGNLHEVIVVYDIKGKVRSFQHIERDAPLPKPEKLVGIES